MMLNGLFHQRRVPKENDGRTEEEKSQPDYRELRSMWYDIDEDQMYTEARRLRNDGFDCRKIVYGILVKGT